MGLAAKCSTPSDDVSAQPNPVANPVAVGGNVVVLHGQNVGSADAAVAGVEVAEVRRIGEGDHRAFGQLMARHLSAVVGTGRRILGDLSEAEDVAQEAFLRLWHGAAELEVGPGGVRPWLRRVASNLAIDRLRRAARMDVTDEVPEQADEATQLRSLEQLELADRVDAALAELPERQRIAVSLFHFEGLSQREVAELMTVSEDALESLLARGRRKLKAALQDDWQQLLHDG